MTRGEDPDAVLRLVGAGDVRGWRSALTTLVQVASRQEAFRRERSFPTAHDLVLDGGSMVLPLEFSKTPAGSSHAILGGGLLERRSVR